MFGAFFPVPPREEDSKVCTYCEGHKVVSFCDCSMLQRKTRCGNYKEEVCPMCKGTGERGNG